MTRSAAGGRSASPLTGGQLSQLLGRIGISRGDKVLLVLAAGAGGVKTVKQVRTEGVAAGLREMNYWNISDVVRRSGGLAVRSGDGYRLSAAGKARVKRVIEEAAAAPAPPPPARPKYA